jgi:hypothetical protein
MQERLNVRGFIVTGLLVVAFAFGVLLSTSVSKAQYMRTQVNECVAFCKYSGGHALCADSCINVPAGKSCTCACNADNLSGGECSSQCDYGVLDDSYCPGL